MAIYRCANASICLLDLSPYLCVFQFVTFSFYRTPALHGITISLIKAGDIGTPNWMSAYLTMVKCTAYSNVWLVKFRAVNYWLEYCVCERQVYRIVVIRVLPKHVHHGQQWHSIYSFACESYTNAFPVNWLQCSDVMWVSAVLNHRQFGYLVNSFRKITLNIETAY